MTSELRSYIGLCLLEGELRGILLPLSSPEDTFLFNDQL